MKIIVAQTAGFCMGVKRAVDMAIDRSLSPVDKLYTLGPLIHNRQTVETLSARGVTTLEKGQEPDEPSQVLIRAHGVPPETEQEFRKKGHELINGTCPKVMTVHRVIQKYRAQGYDIVITGDEGHAEVVGLQGYAGEVGHLVHSPEEVAALPDREKICLVSQTTFDKTTFEAISQRIQERFAGKEVVIKKTICSATDRRQSETKELAQQVDAMIVVGGKHSANTLRLADIAAASGTPTQHVETEREIDLEKLGNCSTVGITAGASTPGWVIKRVIDYLQMFAQRQRPTLGNRTKQLLDVLVNLNVFVALGAVGMYVVSAILQGVPFSVDMLWTGSVISFLYFFSMYLWNSLTNIESIKHLGMSRYEFYHSHRRLLFALALASIAGILLLGYITNPGLFYLMLFLTIAGSLYHFVIVPRALLPLFRYRSIRDVPTSRDLFVALAWAVLLAFVPRTFLPALTPAISTFAVFLWVFVLAYLRSLIFDLRDIEGDRIMGRETLVTIVGEKRVRAGMRVVILACSILVAAGAVLTPNLGVTQRIAWILQLGALLYLYFFARKMRSHRIPHPAIFAVFADLPFLLCTLGAVIPYGVWALGT